MCQQARGTVSVRFNMRVACVPSTPLCQATTQPTSRRWQALLSSLALKLTSCLRLSLLPGHYPTYESAVAGFASAGELRKLRKEAEQKKGRVDLKVRRRLLRLCCGVLCPPRCIPTAAAAPPSHSCSVALPLPAVGWPTLLSLAPATCPAAAGAGAQAAPPGWRRLGRPPQRLDLPLHGWVGGRPAAAGSEQRQGRQKARGARQFQSAVAAEGQCQSRAGHCNPDNPWLHPVAQGKRSPEPCLCRRRRFGDPPLHGGARQGRRARGQRRRGVHPALPLLHDAVSVRGWGKGGASLAQPTRTASRQRSAAVGCQSAPESRFDQRPMVGNRHHSHVSIHAWAFMGSQQRLCGTLLPRTCRPCPPPPPPPLTLLCVRLPGGKALARPSLSWRASPGGGACCCSTHGCSGGQGWSAAACLCHLPSALACCRAGRQAGSRGAYSFLPPAAWCFPPSFPPLPCSAATACSLTRVPASSRWRRPPSGAQGAPHYRARGRGVRSLKSTSYSRGSMFQQTAQGGGGGGGFAVRERAGVDAQDAPAEPATPACLSCHLAPCLPASCTSCPRLQVHQHSQGVQRRWAPSLCATALVPQRDVSFVVLPTQAAPPSRALA